MELSSVELQTYMLEKTRILSVLQGEHSFKAFFLVCYHYMNKSPSTFKMFGKECDVSVADYPLEQFESFISNLELIGFSKTQIEFIMCTLSSIIYLGNVEYVETNEMKAEFTSSSIDILQEVSN